ncbi:hypothetical protein [Azospirillum sp. B4]|uniref:hypothetical protein n=1 Tax=Azospirillum sp. B4 TaxID=95605 RepID=UPI000347850F|nr:hypothetical protein [Azospirillum sp. B4]
MKSIDVARLVEWTYRVQRADMVVDRGVGLFDLERVAAGIAVFKRTTDGSGSHISELGCRVDQMGTPSGELHPDAEAVHEAVRTALTPIQQGLVLLHGRTGADPDWMPGATVQDVVVRRDNGAPRYRYDDHGHKAGVMMQRRVFLIDAGPDGQRQAVDTGLSAEALDCAREVYGQWWDALSRLAGVLVGLGLSSHRITGMPTPREPWLAGAPAKAC